MAVDEIIRKKGKYHMLINKEGKCINEEVLNLYDQICFWGASLENHKVIEKLHLDKKMRYFVDIDENKQNKEMHGYFVFAPSKLECEKNVLILSILTVYAKDIISAVNNYGESECFFYLPDQNMKDIVKENQTVLQAAVSSPRYIHIFYNTVFLKFFYSMIEDHFCIDEHLFIVDMSIVWDDRFGISEFIYQKNLIHKNIIIVRYFGQLEELLSDELNYNAVMDKDILDHIFVDSPRIILHSAVFSCYMNSFLQNMINKGYGKKMVWICWDGDAYFDKDTFVVREILSNIRLAVTAEKHIERITSKCNIKTAGLKYAPYGYVSKSNAQCKDNSFDGELRVLLGHSAAEHCNHKLGFDLLLPYRDEDIKIYSPLSYGSEIYRNYVIQEGRRLFGDKFIPVLDYMGPEQYYLFLDTIHIVLFPMTRMAGATTLSYCNASGKLIYMNEEMIDAFSNGDDGIHAENLSEISDLNWTQFTSKISSSLGGDFSEVNKNIILLWKKIFSMEV